MRAMLTVQLLMKLFNMLFLEQLFLVDNMWVYVAMIVWMLVLMMRLTDERSKNNN